MQYAERTAPECRGRLRTDGEGKYGFRDYPPQFLVGSSCPLRNKVLVLSTSSHAIMPINLVRFGFLCLLSSLGAK